METIFVWLTLIQDVRLQVSWVNVSNKRSAPTYGIGFVIHAYFNKYLDDFCPNSKQESPPAGDHMGCTTGCVTCPGGEEDIPVIGKVPQS